MRSITGSFESVTQFNRDTVTELAPFFDISFSENNSNDYRLWFNNLRALAGENLGLAHSVLHNQTARNSIDIAYKRTGNEIFNRPYAESIGAYSFNKAFSKYRPDTILLTGDTLTGIKYWASQLDTADYIVMFSRIAPKMTVRKVFVDLKSVKHVIVPTGTTIMGMNVAYPCDFHINSKIPAEWVLPDEPVLNDRVANFHYYGLTGNYISLARNLLKQSREQDFGVEYTLKKLELNVDISDMLWVSKFPEIMSNDSPSLMKQYQFARKNLVDITSFFLEIFNTGMCDTESKQSQIFRDSITMCSHVVNLYKHLNNGLMRL
jgi:hypothetical protein